MSIAEGSFLDRAFCILAAIFCGAVVVMGIAVLVRSIVTVILQFALNQ